MTLPPPATPDGDTDARRALTLSLGVTVLLVALKAFALDASGSTSVLASLTESLLDLAGVSLGLFAVRWAIARPVPQVDDSGLRGETTASLVQVGLILASAIFVGLIALVRIADPRPVGGGFWAIGAIVVSTLLTGGLILWQNRAASSEASVALNADRARSWVDLGSGVVALIGVVSGTLLNAPGLDAAAGLVIAVWLFWGGLSLLKTTVSTPPVAPDPSQ